MLGIAIWAPQARKICQYSSLTPYLTRCVDLSTYVILSFCDFILVYCQVAPINFYPFYQSFFNFPPPRVLSLTFHFSLYSSPFLTSFSSLLHLPVCFLSPCVASVSLRPYGWVGLTRKVCGFAHHFPRQHRTRTQRAQSTQVSSPIPCSNSRR